MDMSRSAPDYHDMLADPEIDVIDIVLPPFLHTRVAKEAIEAGKHVICEKPLTGYFGERGQENIGKTVPKSEMYKACVKEMDELRPVVRSQRLQIHVRRELRICNPGTEGSRDHPRQEEQAPLHEGRGKPEGFLQRAGRILEQDRRRQPGSYRFPSAGR